MPAMLPNFYACTGCGEVLHYASRDAVYYLGNHTEPLSGQIRDGDLLEVPVRPGWCKDCATVCIVEDIAPLRAFENAFGSVRAGGTVEYPTRTENLTAQQAGQVIETYLRWRLRRRHAARALCCGRTNFQLLDVPMPLFKHSGCDFGVVEARYTFSPYNGPGPGVYSDANIGVFNGEGALIGRLTRREQGSDVWTVCPAEYALDDAENSELS